MKVKELIEILAKCNPEDDVILACDPEGNRYRKLSKDGINSKEYNYLEKDNEINIGFRGLTKKNLLEGIPCVIIWPD